MITHRLMAFEILSAFLVLLLLVDNQRPLMVQAFGYSYSRFIGPVRGPERQIIVHDRYDGRGRVDYVARPEYQFAYGVEDAKTRVLQNRRETRNGDAVKGVYSVVDPDGSLRVVKYTADNVNGFQAEVTSNGVSTNHGQDNPVVVHPDPQQLTDDDGATGAAVVNAKDETKPLQPNHHIQVQHPENSPQTPPPRSYERETTGGVKKIPANVEEVNNESSDSRDASDYQEENDDDDVADGGRSSESRNESKEKDDDDDDSSEEVEDY
ncbi:uncharacterized protein LOC129948197 [Eupeodes corollae]|uniref:uncharacterized protein LOC129948197 n=1 Tax=Eupeodes corollae TaxID=290404 RepID=UPI002491A4FF|nr:uncharacterized protein LOC129948197 [Eupeodes corollae]